MPALCLDFVFDRIFVSRHGCQTEFMLALFVMSRLNLFFLLSKVGYRRFFHNFRIFALRFINKQDCCQDTNRVKALVCVGFNDRREAVGVNGGVEEGVVGEEVVLSHHLAHRARSHSFHLGFVRRRQWRWS